MRTLVSPSPLPSHPSAFKVEQVCESRNKIMCKMNKKYESMNMDELGYSSFAMRGEVGCPFGVDLQKILPVEPLTKFTTVFKVENLSAFK